jgi:hypothetical protein
MPDNWKSELGNERVAQRTRLDMPVIGMEAEFNVFVDGVEIIPEEYWKHPSAFIDVPMLHRTEKSSQLPTGGAVYFDRGVIEVVTPVIEIAPGCTARVVRNLWEQIEFVRSQLSRWEKTSGHHVRLKAYSTHYNVSYELDAGEQNRNRNVRALALLLAYVLPVPVMMLAANRRSTGIGVRPRGNRIEITLDFTPDPGLMIAAAAFVVGVVREVMSWPSYELSLLDRLPIPVIDGVVPGKHTTRKGWLTKDFHYPQSPYTCDIDAPLWRTRDGRTLALRTIAREVGEFFRHSIRRHSDPFSQNLVFAVFEGKAPSLLELKDRPAAYEDVGRLCRWGSVVQELRDAALEESMLPMKGQLWGIGTIDEHVAGRESERKRIAAEAEAKRERRPERRPAAGGGEGKDPAKRAAETPAITTPPRPSNGRGRHSAVRVARLLPASARGSRRLRRRSNDIPGGTLPPRPADYLDRRAKSERSFLPERRKDERRKRAAPIPFPDRRLTRSAYEKVFLRLVSGLTLYIAGEPYRPVGMKGWYHAIFLNVSTGRQRLLTIDQLLGKMRDWR